MKKITAVSEEEIALFRKTVGDITPLKQDGVYQSTSQPKPKPRSSKIEKRASSPFYDSEFEENLLERGDELFFVRPGVQKQTIRKLRRGKITIDATLDLHGMTVEMARTALQDFLDESQHDSWRCVSIIHGKGISANNKKPIIKNKVNNWLRQRNEILAFCSATQKDGGTGAVYVMLKSSSTKV